MLTDGKYEQVNDPDLVRSGNVAPDKARRTAIVFVCLGVVYLGLAIATYSHRGELSWRILFGALFLVFGAMWFARHRRAVHASH